MADATKTQKIHINNLVEATVNPNVLSSADMESLVAFISQAGALQPILVRPIADGKYEIVDGHHRVEAHRRLGMGTIKAEVVDISPDEAEAYRIALNKLRGDIDVGVASDVMARLANHGMDTSTLATLTGYLENEVNDFIHLAQASVEDALNSSVGSPDNLGDMDALPEDDEPADEPTKPWTIALEFTDKKVFTKMKRALKKAAGPDGSLEDGLVRLVDG